MTEQWLGCAGPEYQYCYLFPGQRSFSVSSVSSTLLFSQIITHVLSRPCPVSPGSHHLLLSYYTASQPPATLRPFFLPSSNLLVIECFPLRGLAWSGLVTTLTTLITRPGGDWRDGGAAGGLEAE